MLARTDEKMSEMKQKRDGTGTAQQKNNLADTTTTSTALENDKGSRLEETKQEEEFAHVTSAEDQEEIQQADETSLNEEL